MVKVGDKIIPFDLKITHISDDYFDQFSQGLTLTKDQNASDSFTIGNNLKEIEVIKKYYKEKKKILDLPNYGGLKKFEIIEILQRQTCQDTQIFLESIQRERSNMVMSIKSDLKSVEWWNYKYQGERLFKNNNRFFVFLAYTNSFKDARPLKGNLEDIAKKVSGKLNTIANGKFNTNKYYSIFKKIN